MPSYTIDAERLWLSGRPIVFVGKIKDIASSSDGYYQCQIGDGDTRLTLLDCPNPSTDKIVEEIRGRKRGLLLKTDTVAVVATVEDVSVTYETVDGHEESVIRGRGRYRDMICLPVLSFEAVTEMGRQSFTNSWSKAMGIETETR